MTRSACRGRAHCAQALNESQKHNAVRRTTTTTPAMARSPGVLGTLLTFGMNGAMLLNWRGVCEFAGRGLRLEEL